MHRMPRWLRVLLLLGCSVLGHSAPQEDAITNAVDTCKHKLDTNFDFKFLDVPAKTPQNKGMFRTYSSYFHRPIPLLQRLFPRLYKPPNYQFILTRAWKKTLPETSPQPGNTDNTVVRTCSGFLTSQQPIKYIFSCNNVTQEGTEWKKIVEVSPVTATKTSAAVEGSGSNQDEELPEEDNDTWDLSRCLGCIFGMLNKPVRQ